MSNLHLIAFFAFTLLVFGCISPQKPTNSVDTSNAITAKMCKDFRGNWNGTNCLCGGIAGFACPPGYVCTEYFPPNAADSMGVCKKSTQ